MNTDIRLSVGFWQHPKTKKTVKRLGLPGIRSLQILWLWASANRPDGLLSGMDWEDIELCAEWDGEERAFFTECLERWLDDTPEGFRLHDWEEHNPWQAEAGARSEKARKAAKAKWSNAHSNKEQCDDAARAMPGQCPRDARKQSGQCPSPLLSSPHPQGRKKESCDSSPEQSAIAAGSAENPLDAVITLPLNTGQEHPVTRGELEQWQDLYPAVDVGQALRNMRGWLLANKRRRKTRPGIGRFIQAWLAREQDRPPALQERGREEGGEGRNAARPVACTQSQKQNQDREDLAKFVLAAQQELHYGHDTAHHGGTWETGPAVPAVHASG